LHLMSERQELAARSLPVRQQPRLSPHDPVRPVVIDRLPEIPS
jgi:hypothetical protein